MIPARLPAAGGDPGRPDAGTSWHEAQRVCLHLGGDGLTLLPEPQEFWRLPTVDGAVRSMARHGLNSGGVWQAGSATASSCSAPRSKSGWLPAGGRMPPTYRDFVGGMGY